MKFLIVLSSLACLFSGINFAYSQEQDIDISGQQLTSDQMLVQKYAQFEQRVQLQNPQINIDQIPSLFLSGNEINLLIDAKKGLFTRPPTEEELNAERENSRKGQVSRPNSVREIALGGILYQSSTDWTIWLNSQKITPKNLPPAIMDIQVSKEHIKLKWLDFQTNQIFPVKLRENQRFNFDTRIFLPG